MTQVEKCDVDLPLEGPLGRIGDAATKASVDKPARTDEYFMITNRRETTRLR